MAPKFKNISVLIAEKDLIKELEHQCLGYVIPHTNSLNACYAYSINNELPSRQ